MGTSPSPVNVHFYYTDNEGTMKVSMKEDSGSILKYWQLIRNKANSEEKWADDVIHW